MTNKTFNYPDEINNDVKFEFRGGTLRSMFGKSGWYIVSPKITQGPFESEQKAKDVFFYDRHYR